MKKSIALALMVALGASAPLEGRAQSIPTLLDLGNSFVHFGASTQYNQLYSEIEGRMTLSGAAGSHEYLLMAQHPREGTFKDDGLIYGSQVSTYGASFITFLYDPNDNSMVISRRFDKPTTAIRHECLASAPYNGGLPVAPATIPPADLVELSNKAEIVAAASAQKKILGLLEYTAGGTNVRIEFPADVLNINPDANAAVGKQWQIASSQIPIYMPESTYCKSIKNGYVAFGRVGSGVTLSFNYLCETYAPNWSEDFSCAQNYTGTVRLFAKQ